MKKLFSLLAGLLAWQATAADSPIGLKPIVASPVTSNFLAIVTGSGATATFRLFPLTNAFQTLAALNPKIESDFRFYDALYVAGDLTVTQQVAAASFLASGEVAAQSFRGTGTDAGSFSLNATNGTGSVTWTVHKDLATQRANITGEVHASAAGVVEFDTLKGDLFLVTNRISANLSQVLTNYNGASMSGIVLGNASTPYTVTTIPNTGILIANLNDFSAALATSVSETLTNGNALEWSAKVHRLNGTNVLGYVSRQFKF